jgi:hypothetical protein
MDDSNDIEYIVKKLRSISEDSCCYMYPAEKFNHIVDMAADVMSSLQDDLSWHRTLLDIQNLPEIDM